MTNNPSVEINDSGQEEGKPHSQTQSFNSVSEVNNQHGSIPQVTQTNDSPSQIYKDIEQQQTQQDNKTDNENPPEADKQNEAGKSSDGSKTKEEGITNQKEKDKEKEDAKVNEKEKDQQKEKPKEDKDKENETWDVVEKDEAKEQEKANELLKQQQEIDKQKKKDRRKDKDKDKEIQKQKEIEAEKEKEKEKLQQLEKEKELKKQKEKEREKERQKRKEKEKEKEKELQQKKDKEKEKENIKANDKQNDKANAKESDKDKVQDKKKEKEKDPKKENQKEKEQEKEKEKEKKKDEKKKNEKDQQKDKVQKKDDKQDTKDSKSQKKEDNKDADKEKLKEQERIKEQEKLKEQERIKEQERLKEQERIRVQEQIKEQERLKAKEALKEKNRLEKEKEKQRWSQSAGTKSISFDKVKENEKEKEKQKEKDSSRIGNTSTQTASSSYISGSGSSANQNAFSQVRTTTIFAKDQLKFSGDHRRKSSASVRIQPAQIQTTPQSTTSSSSQYKLKSPPLVSPRINQQSSLNSSRSSRSITNQSQTSTSNILSPKTSQPTSNAPRSIHMANASYSLNNTTKGADKQSFTITALANQPQRSTEKPVFTLNNSPVKIAQKLSASTNTLDKSQLSTTTDKQQQQQQQVHQTPANKYAVAALPNVIQVPSTDQSLIRPHAHHHHHHHHRHNKGEPESVVDQYNELPFRSKSTVPKVQVAQIMVKSPQGGIGGPAAAKGPGVRVPKQRAQSMPRVEDLNYEVVQQQNLAEGYIVRLNQMKLELNRDRVTKERINSYMTPEVLKELKEMLIWSNQTRRTQDLKIVQLRACQIIESIVVDNKGIVDRVIKSGIVEEILATINTVLLSHIQHVNLFLLHEFFEVCSDEQKLIYIGKGFIPAMRRILDSQDELCVLMAVWMIERLLCASFLQTPIGAINEARRIIENDGTLEKLVIVLQNDEYGDQEINRKAAMAIGQAFKAAPIPADFRNEVIVLIKKITNSDDEDVCGDAIRVLAGLAECQENHVIILSANYQQDIKNQLTHNHDLIVEYSLQLVLNILTHGLKETIDLARAVLPIPRIAELTKSATQAIADNAKAIIKKLEQP
ncbi:MAG: hypothetical protein EZS28_001630 [Streblomastix strix]|uniref:Uncharacterized protein n=1 Tax=Streblomastix strix TaxID=222440 RepID=A0A5J4X755_9EUKA|nr:MAG: hypothetical protein EZS28_001630 [Streblomastix strix]